MARELKNILVNRIVEHALAEVAPLASGRMLDVGCGLKPYREMFEPYVTEHVGLDHEDTPHDLTEADLIGTAYSIPAEDDSFDTVLCSAVLEHLEEPAQALSEARRVLKPGGVAIYTVPFIWHLHEEPRDFFRYSKHGLAHLFRAADFEVTALRPLSGFWVTFGQLFVYYIHRANRGPLKRTHVIPVLGLLIQAAAYVLDRLDRAEEWTWMYLVVARGSDENAHLTAPEPP